MDNLIEIKKFSPNLIFMNGAIHHLDDSIMKSINSFVSKFQNTIFLSVDPIKYQNKFLNRIMIFFDRGKFIRRKEEYNSLMQNYEQFITDDFYQMSFQNVFHFKNINILKLYNSWKKIIN